MNLFALSGILISVSSLIEGFIVIIRGNRKEHFIWGLFCFSIMLWGFGGYQIANSASPESAVFWWRVAYAGVIFIPVFLLHFLTVLLGTKKWAVKFIYLAGFLFLALNFFDGVFIDKVDFLFNEIYYLSHPTVFYNIFVLLFGLSTVLSLYAIWKRYKKSQGFKRHQLKYLFLSLLVGFAGGSTSFFPVYGIYVYPLFNVTIAVGVLVVGYAILKYRLMDLRIVARKFFIYIFSAAFAYITFYSLVWLYQTYLGGVFTNSSYISGILVALAFAGAFSWFYGFVENFANKYFFSALYKYQKTIEGLGQKLSYMNDLGEVLDLITGTIKEFIALENVAVYLLQADKNEYKKTALSGFKKDLGDFVNNSNFKKYLQEKQKPVVKEELGKIAEDSNDLTDAKIISEMNTEMEALDISLCIPLISNKELKGLILLGPKKTKDAYTKEDLEMLSILSYQASAAIDNARLYKEVLGLNKNLQRKVDEQTESIRQLYEAEKEAKEKINAIRVEDEALLSSIGEGVVAIDNEGKITFVNKEAEDSLYVRGESIINKPYEQVLLAQNEKGEIIAKEKDPLYKALVHGKKVVASATMGTENTCYYTRSDRSKFPVYVTAAPVVLNGKVVGAVDVFRDVTVERQIDKSKSEFVSLASHQLRTPLTAIKWYSEFLLRGKAGKLAPKQKKNIEQIYHGNERMIKLIAVMLNISRLEAGRVKINLMLTNPKKLLQDLIKEEKIAARKKKQKINFECEGEIADVRTDPDLIRMVLENLIANGIKYSGKGGEIICRLKEKGKVLLFEIEDNGIGIPKDQQKRIFEKLFRANNAFPHDPEGNGLGLYATKMTVEALGGKIYFKSEEGKGSVFFVEIPAIKG